MRTLGALRDERPKHFHGFEYCRLGGVKFGRQFRNDLKVLVVIDESKGQSWAFLSSR
jgi:hypothetical protein